MQKLDHRRSLKELYGPSARKIAFVDVPGLNFLRIEGRGEPGGAEFQAALAALYPVAYAVKFAIRKARDIDFRVMPLEGLWWSDDMDDFISGRRERWCWDLMLMQPDCVDQGHVEAAIASVASKQQPPALSRLRFESFTEGRCAQILHIGPFSGEGPAIERLHAAIAEQGASLSGRHHEIYLSDMRRAAPENFRTVLRQPMSQAQACH